MVAALLTFCFAKRVVVHDWSMSPTLVPGEYVLIDRLAYRREGPQRGDIVLARHPQRPELLLIKRVAGLPGEQMRCQEEAHGITGVPDRVPGPDSRTGTGATVWNLTAGQYFLVGDAPAFSTDSRRFGPVPRRGMLGRAWLVYWPVGHFRALPRTRQG